MASDLLRRQYDEMVSENTRLQALVSEQSQEIARLRLDKAATTAVLAEYVGVVNRTNHPRMDGSDWKAVLDLAQRGSIFKQIGDKRAALAARGGEAQS